MTATGPKIGRVILLDVLRGVAIIGVVFYHFMFDLRLTGFIALDVTYDRGWVAFAHILSGTFLTLVGTNLVLAHARGMHWPAYWRRMAWLVGAAVLITIGTFFAFREMFIYFGILHAIALFSLLALPFLRLPVWVSGLTAIAVVALPQFLHAEFFDSRWTSWIGFWVVPPETGDLVPVFPSFAWTLAGIVIGKALVGSSLGPRVSGIPFAGGTWQMLARLGRWSLWIYLLHQLVLLAIIYPLAQVFVHRPEPREGEFFGSCYSSCLDQGNAAPQCQVYCNCALDQVKTKNFWDALDSQISTPEQRKAVADVSAQCKAAGDGGE